MGAAARSVAIAVVGLALLPAAALGASVNRDTETGVLTIVDDDSDAVDDNIVVERVGGTTDQVRGAGLTNDSSDCTTAGAAIDCPLSTSVAVNLGGGNDSFGAIAMPVPISVAGGPGNDDIATSGGPDVLAGGPGDDTLQGNSGIDDYFGEAGNDTIKSFDRNPERVSCGGDTDVALNDFVDILAECERGADGDRDGFSSAVDCNDGAREHLPRRARGVRQRRRRELRRPRQPEPGPRPRRLPPARRLRRRQRQDPPGRARDPRQQGGRELRPARGAVRPARRRRLQPVGGDQQVRAADPADRAQRAEGRADRADLQGPRVPVAEDPPPHRQARTPEGRAASRVPPRAAVDSGRG